MANDQLPAQLHHLWAASHALAATSPAVSAHLMTRLFELSSDRGIALSETTTRHACAACGTITIPGWNSHVHTSRNHKRKRKSSKPPKAQKEASPIVLRLEQPGGDRAREAPISKLRVMYECRICGSSTAQQVPPIKSSRVRSRLASKKSTSLPVQVAVGGVSSDIHPSPSSSSAAPMPSQNSNSRKRAKSRKGNSLSDILAAKKKQDSSSSGQRGGAGGFGLDLMDLMKIG